MKFDKRHSVFRVIKDTWCIIPTIVIHGYDFIYREKNMSVSFHWLCFHARLMWFEKEKNNE